MEKLHERYPFLKGPSSPEARYYFELPEIVSLTRKEISDVLLRGPFSERLVKTDYESNTVALKGVHHHPERLIREHIDVVNDDRYLHEIVQKILEFETILKEWEVKHGLHVVSRDSIVAKNGKRQVTIFTIVDNIEGKSLEQMSHFPSEAVDELEKVYSTMSDHYFNVWQKGGPYWYDVGNKQFVYGNKHGDSEKHVYLVDVDPLIEDSEFPRMSGPIFKMAELVEAFVEVMNKFQLRDRFGELCAILLTRMEEMGAEYFKESLHHNLTKKSKRILDEQK